MIAPPATEPLSLSEAKSFLRIDFDDDNDTIESLIKQAREFCEDYQGKRYVTQTLELVLDRFGGDIEFINCSPVQSIISFKYTDSEGNERALESTDYILDTDSFVNRIVPGYNKEWPSIALQPINAVRIRFIAGYEDKFKVPETVKWAMALHMRLLYGDYEQGEQEQLERKRNILLGMKRVVPV